MNFELTEEESMIADTASRISRDHLAPSAAALDRGDGDDILIANLKRIADAGFAGLNIEEEYGGSGLGASAIAIAQEAFGYGCASTAVTTGVNGLVAGVIQTAGSEDQKQRYLTKLASGETLGASFCLTEPTAGSDPSNMVTRAKMDGNEWVLNGGKIYISSAPFADFMVVFARTDPDAAPAKGVSCFIVEATASGLEIGKAEEKMGQIGSATSTVTFDNCRIPADALLGGLNQGFKVAMGELHASRIGVAAMALGIARAAMDHALAYIVEREQSGQKLAEFQGIQWMVADRETEIDAARLLIQRAAYLRDHDQPFNKEAAMAKLYATETAQRATYTALQLHGGAGYLKDFPLERFARDARVTTIYEGTSEIQRVIIAREILKAVA